MRGNVEEGEKQSYCALLRRNLECTSLNKISLEEENVISCVFRFIIVMPLLRQEAARASSFSCVHSSNPDIS